MSQVGSLAFRALIAPVVKILFQSLIVIESFLNPFLELG